MKFRGGTARALINWLKSERYKFPVLAVVDNLVPMDIIDVMSDRDAVNIIQRLDIDRQLIEMVDLCLLLSTYILLLDKKHTILSSTVGLLDKK